ncbi:MAG: DNA polymerase IV [Candidatus Eremiobacteraeota bacterium]|nr:DNA polymerase IV [Candidatus Eremiobacteraeota bacterium]
MGPRERIILHADMNSYFATVEQQANPLLRGRPIAVGGSLSSRTVVAAASVEAKKFGVKSGMPLGKAMGLCPGLIVVEGDQDKYMELTTRIFRILRDYTPLLELFSIDEAFLDITDTCERFGGSLEVALGIKRRLREEIGEWIRCSIGIGPSKIIAKLASELKKPDGLVMVEKGEIGALLGRMKLSDLCGIGERMEKRLIDAGIDTIEKLRAAPVEHLVRRFGITGHVLHRMSLGEDSSPVLPYYESPPYKSMGHHYTFPRDLEDLEEVKRTLLRLSEQVGRRLRAQHYAGKTITLTLRAFDFFSHRRQRTIGDYIDDGYRIYTEACAIMESLAFRGAVRMIGVSVSSLVKEYRPLPLFDDERKAHFLLEALDRINDRYGEFTILRASITGTRLRKRTGGYVGVKKR